MIDVTNCYHQFEIEKSARKLFIFEHLGDLLIKENGDGNKSRKQRNPEENARNNQGMSQHAQYQR